MLGKILPIFVLPLGVAGLLLIWALIKQKRWPVAAALAVLYFSSIPFVGNRLIGGLESRYAAVPIAEVESADAVVVLGGIFGPPVKEGYISNIGEAVERFEAGIVLTQTGKASWLVFTGGRLPWEGRDMLEGEQAKAQALQRGIPAAKIFVTREVGNTADEARAISEMMRERNWKRVILVTTGWHMPRAARLFNKAGIDCVFFPVDFRRDVNRPLSALDFVPAAEALRNTETALREYYGFAFYALTGW